MSPRIVGESGVVLDVDREMARGLVRDGFAKLAEGESESVLARPMSAIATTINPEVGSTVTAVGNSAPETAKAAGEADQDGKPGGNASREKWVEYALANGKTEDDLNGLKQTEIRALFETPEE